MGHILIINDLSNFSARKLQICHMKKSKHLSSCLICNLFQQIPGLVNVDFADVRAIMADAGSSLMGIGTATGKLFIE